MAHGRPDGPPLSGVTILASSGCNQRCSYCCVNGRPPASPPWAAVHRTLDALLASPADCVRIGFSGGEPLLARPLMARVVTYISSHKRPSQAVNYRLLTNGLLLDSRTLSWLRRHDFTLQISCDGTREAQERRSPGTFDTLNRLWLVLRRNSPDYFRSNVSVALTLVPETVPRLAESVSHLIRNGLASVRISPVMDAARARRGLFDELDQQFAEVFQLSRAHFWRTGKVPVAAFRKGLPRRARQPASPWVCQAPTGECLTVDVDGQVSTCTLATRTYADGRPLRPLIRHAAEALRLGAPEEDVEARVREIRTRAPVVHAFSSSAPRHSAAGLCRECAWVSECVVCPLTVAGVRGPERSLRVPSFQCAFNQAVAKYRAAFPIQLLRLSGPGD